MRHGWCSRMIGSGRGQQGPQGRCSPAWGGGEDVATPLVG